MYSQIIKQVLGTEGLKRYLDRYGLDLPAIYEDVVKDYPRISWNTFIQPHNKEKCTSDAFDLLTKLLQFDHQVNFIHFHLINSLVQQQKKQWHIHFLMK